MSDEEHQQPAPQTQDDVKPEATDPNTINIKVSLPPLPLFSARFRVAFLRLTRRSGEQVVSSTGEEVFFKIKRNTKLSKLQGAYAGKVGKDVGSIR